MNCGPSNQNCPPDQRCSRAA